MNDNFQAGRRIALVAADAVGLAALRPTRELLDAFGVAWGETLVPTVDAATCNAPGWQAVVVASPDAVLPGALAARTRLPVVRVPVGNDAVPGTALLLDPATANLPASGGSFATVAVGEAGARNAALFIVSVLALKDSRLWVEWIAYRQRQTDAVLAHPPLDPA